MYVLYKNGKYHCSHRNACVFTILLKFNIKDGFFTLMRLFAFKRTSFNCCFFCRINEYRYIILSLTLYKPAYSKWSLASLISLNCSFCLIRSSPRLEFTVNINSVLSYVIIFSSHIGNSCGPIAKPSPSTN
jgi:hypothetical protein